MVFHSSTSPPTFFFLQCELVICLLILPLNLSCLVIYFDQNIVVKVLSHNFWGRALRNRQLTPLPLGAPTLRYEKLVMWRDPCGDLRCPINSSIWAFSQYPATWVSHAEAHMTLSKTTATAQHHLEQKTSPGEPHEPTPLWVILLMNGCHSSKTLILGDILFCTTDNQPVYQVSYCYRLSLIEKRFSSQMSVNEQELSYAEGKW